MFEWSLVIELSPRLRTCKFGRLPKAPFSILHARFPWKLRKDNEGMFVNVPLAIITILLFSINNVIRLVNR